MGGWKLGEYTPRQSAEMSSLSSEGVYASPPLVDHSGEAKDAAVDDNFSLFMREAASYRLLDKEEAAHYSKTYHAGVAAEQLLEESDKLTEDKIHRLEQVVAASREAKQIMIKANLRLVVAHAKKFYRASDKLDLIDLVQEGSIGLNRAVEKYAPNKGYEFSTYAVWWIRQNLQKAMTGSTTIRLPVHLLEEGSSLRRAREKLVTELGRSPTDKELSEYTGRTIERIHKLGQYITSAYTESLHEPFSGSEDDHREKHETIEDQGALEPFSDVETEVDMQLVYRLGRKVLDKRSQQILTKRYGLKGNHSITLDAIGQELGLTRERVRQLEKLALVKLKEALENHGITGTDDSAA